jgi:fatty-acyl-CoA synthase
MRSLSIASGPPLSAEPGLGPLTLPGFLREVTTSFREREALVLRSTEGVTRWTYAELWERAIEVARALRACGVGKGSRVGVLMTNRPEWIAAVFGTSLAGGVAVALSTFSTRPELEHLLQDSAVSVLLFERSVLNKDFAAVLTELEPEIGKAAPGALQSAKFPYLRGLAMVGEAAPGGAVESWEVFLARGRNEPRELVEATAAAVRPSDAAVLFFSSGTTSKPKGILSAHRGITIQLWRFRRMYGFRPEDHIRCWTANGFFWSGNVGMAIGATFASGGALVLQPTFDAAEARST